MNVMNTRRDDKAAGKPRRVEGGKDFDVLTGSRPHKGCRSADVTHWDRIGQIGDLGAGNRSELHVGTVLLKELLAVSNREYDCAETDGPQPKKPDSHIAPLRSSIKSARQRPQPKAASATQSYTNILDAWKGLRCLLMARSRHSLLQDTLIAIGRITDIKGDGESFFSVGNDP